MSAQASVRSIESLKDFRVVLSLYGDDTLGALGGIEAMRRSIRPKRETLQLGTTTASHSSSRHPAGRRQNALGMRQTGRVPQIHSVE